MKLVAPIAANVASQSYAALLGIVLLPIYLRVLGSEAFGLIALSVVMQACIALLDFGLAATLIRATATYRSGGLSADALRNLWRHILRVYVAIGAATLTVLLVAVFFFTERWFRRELLAADVLTQSLLLICTIIVLRWFSELLRSIHAGFERFVWLSKFNAIVATARFAMILPLLAWSDVGIVGFFIFQLVVALLELGSLAALTRRLIPLTSTALRTNHPQTLRSVWRFALPMALASSSWVLVSNTDKVLLSGLMSLAEYGEFTLATLMSSTVLIVTTPLVAVILPRMTALVTQRDHEAFRCMYGHSTQWLGLLAWPGAAMLAFHGERLLFAWTADPLLASRVAPVLQLYAVGNALLAVSAVAFVGHFARGELKLHLFGSALYVLLLLPLVTWSTSKYGSIGAAWVWLLLNAAYLVFWLMFTHRRRGPYAYSRWFMRDVLPLAVPAFAISAIGVVLPWPDQILLLVAQLIPMSLLTLLVTSLGSSWAREAKWFGALHRFAKGKGKPVAAQSNRERHNG